MAATAWTSGIGMLGVRRTPVAALITMLLAIDVVLIAFHISMTPIGFPGGFVFDLGADRSYSEFFQYAKNAWAMMILAVLAWQRRAGIFVAWAIVCGYFFVDDAFMLHERAGWAVRDAFPSRPDAAVHLGELGFLAAVGIILLTIVVIAHVRADRRDREVSAVLMLLFALLILFGVVLDAIHHLLFPGPESRMLFTTLEDGGELILLSLVVGFVHAVDFGGHTPRTGGRLSRLVGGASRGV